MCEIAELSGWCGIYTMETVSILALQAFRRSVVGGSFIASTMLQRGSKTKGMRGNVSPKRGNRFFYKGSGCRKLGTHGRRGKYYMYPNLESMLNMDIPDLRGFELKPYVPITEDWVESKRLKAIQSPLWK